MGLNEDLYFASWQSDHTINPFEEIGIWKTWLDQLQLNSLRIVSPFFYPNEKIDHVRLLQMAISTMESEAYHVTIC